MPKKSLNLITSKYYKQQGNFYGSILGSTIGLQASCYTTLLFLKYFPEASESFAKICFLISITMYTGGKLGSYFGGQVGLFAGTWITKNISESSSLKQIRICNYSH